MPRFHVTHDDLPAGPPPEVLAQIEVAWERAQAFAGADLEICFEQEGRLVWAELRRADGTVARRLTAGQAVALACGDVLPGLAPAP